MTRCARYFEGTPWGEIAVATVLACAIGYAVIARFLRYISTHDFRPFVYYRIGLALAVFGMRGTGVVTAS
ncbi:undecaprenyl-diphosphate phosphatase [Leekyejoonella antrihumi]|uniref:Undecaprenyl-diphosphatase n=1 Tax=Leekyejoonella antrihumi TaxID=1660198 RepID=A0A563E5E3_9MICO|nr:undecaprenyl-diphosphate phosphatase [Leekyejoonella antrihumi]TWP37645.1 hypothetical protein FGL98_05400 [Leekyejoonella antrihumi]